MIVLLAFEVFDDVAFYWFLQTLLGLAVVPYTLLNVIKTIRKFVKPDENETVLCRCSKCSGRNSQFKKTSLLEIFTPKVVIFIVLWILFILLVLQVPEFEKASLASFDPYGILELETGATEKEIKKAYRNLSLRWHPDKNMDDQDAEKMFVMISKAYQTLTDDAVRENYEKYGNPDGYQGTSVTIGLPSSLTDKDNEFFILMIYVGLLIFLVIGVGLWWTAARKYHKSGITYTTLEIYWRVITARVPIIEILAASEEYKYLALSTASAQYGKLMEGVGRKKSGYCFNEEYVKRSCSLLYAYLRRVPVPERLWSDMRFVLQKTHHLLDTMFEMVTTRSLIDPSLKVMQLSQLLTQALWPDQDPLMQIPGFTQAIVKKCRKKNMTLLSLKRLNAQERLSFLRSLSKFDDTVLSDMNHFLTALPDIEVKYYAQTDGESAIEHRDLVSITFQLTRRTESPDKDSLNPLLQKESNEDVEKEINDIDDVPIIPKKRRSHLDDDSGVLAHSPCFPFSKREQWVILLIDKNFTSPTGGTRERIVGVERVASLVDTRTINMNVRAHKEGSAHYVFHLLSDSYIGVDQKLEFDFEVGKGIDVHNHQHSHEEDGRVEEDEEPRTSPKWYYLGGESVVELILTLILFYLMYLAVITSSFGRKHIQPWVDSMHGFVMPMYTKYGAGYVQKLSEVVLEPLMKVVWTDNGSRWLQRFCKDVFDICSSGESDEGTDGDAYTREEL